MNNEQNLNISNALAEGFTSIFQGKEIIKLKRKRITLDCKRILIYASLISLVQLFIPSNAIGSFFFLTGATHLLNNSLFPELVSCIAVLAEGIAKLSGGLLLDVVHNHLFNRSKNYDNLEELERDIIEKELENDIAIYNLNIYDTVFKKMESTGFNPYRHVAKYRTLGLDDGELKAKYDELINLLREKAMIGKYINASTCRKDIIKDKDYYKIKYARWLFWMLLCFVNSKFLGMVGLVPSLLFSMIMYIALMIGTEKSINYKNDLVMKILEEKKLSIDGFKMPQDIEILKMKYNKIKRELESKGSAFIDLYYNYCINQIAIEENKTSTLSKPQNYKPISKGIAPIDRGYETNLVDVKSRKLSREDKS